MTDRFTVVEACGAQVGVTRVPASDSDEGTAEVVYSFFLQDVRGVPSGTVGLATFSYPVVQEDGGYIEDIEQETWDTLTSERTVNLVVQRALEHHQEEVQDVVEDEERPLDLEGKFIHQPSTTLH